MGLPAPIGTASATGVGTGHAALKVTQTVLLRDLETLDDFRFWIVGSVAGRDMTVVGQIAPFLGVGVVMALLAGRSLNALALGDAASEPTGD